MRRREFLVIVGGAAATWPLAARAQQQVARMRLIGWLDSYDESDAGPQSIRSALREGLAELGWTEGRNLEIVQRFGLADASRLRTAAAELVSLSPEAIVALNGAAARALRQATQTIPIIFTGGGDPVANGLVKDIAHPEGNITGFSTTEPAVAGKWLELLKAAAVFNPDTSPSAPNYVAAIERTARALSVQAVRMPFRDAIELVRSIDRFAAQADGGLVMLPPSLISDRTAIIKLAAEHRLPAIYMQRAVVAEGGLMSYGPDPVEQNLRAASYVDRILRGAKVSDLPVQFPTKYELVVNVKTANVIGLTIPEAFLLHADALIE